MTDTFVAPEPVVFHEKAINYWEISDLLHDFYGRRDSTDDYVAAQISNILNNPDTDADQKFELTLSKLRHTRGDREQPVRLARILFRKAGNRVTDEQLDRKW